MKLSDVMDELADRLGTVPGLRVFAYPPGSVTPPAAIVAYPSDYTYDETYGRGMDRMTLPVVVVVGRPTEPQSRDALTRYVDGSGPASLKALLDAAGYVACDVVTVTGVDFDVYTIGGVDYLTAVFNLDIVGQGA